MIMIAVEEEERMTVYKKEQEKVIGGRETVVVMGGRRRRRNCHGSWVLKWGQFKCQTLITPLFSPPSTPPAAGEEREG